MPSRPYLAAALAAAAVAIAPRVRADDAVPLPPSVVDGNALGSVMPVALR